jgi:hypothetical protein
MHAPTALLSRVLHACTTRARFSLCVFLSASQAARHALARHQSTPALHGPASPDPMRVNLKKKRVPGSDLKQGPAFVMSPAAADVNDGGSREPANAVLMKLSFRF